jgi:hypothetical protein
MSLTLLLSLTKMGDRARSIRGLLQAAPSGKTLKGRRIISEDSRSDTKNPALCEDRVSAPLAFVGLRKSDDESLGSKIGTHFWVRALDRRDDLLNLGHLDCAITATPCKPIIPA